jgi:hypothetical protein
VSCTLYPRHGKAYRILVRNICRKENIWKTRIRWFVSLFLTQQPPSGIGPPHYQGFGITLRYTTLGRTPLEEQSASRRDLCFTTHDIHNKHPCHKEIRTYNLSRRSVAEPRIRPLGHWDRQDWMLRFYNCFLY